MTVSEAVQACIEKHVERQGSTGAKYEYIVISGQCRIDDPTTGGWSVWKWPESDLSKIELSGERNSSIESAA